MNILSPASLLLGPPSIIEMSKFQPRKKGRREKGGKGKIGEKWWIKLCLSFAGAGGFYCQYQKKKRKKRNRGGKRGRKEKN